MQTLIRRKFCHHIVMAHDSAQMFFSENTFLIKQACRNWRQVQAFKTSLKDNGVLSAEWLDATSMDYIYNKDAALQIVMDKLHSLLVERSSEQHSVECLSAIIRSVPDDSIRGMLAFDWQFDIAIPDSLIQATTLAVHLAAAPMPHGVSVIHLPKCMVGILSSENIPGHQSLIKRLLPICRCIIMYHSSLVSLYCTPSVKLTFRISHFCDIAIFGLCHSPSMGDMVIKVRVW